MCIQPPASDNGSIHRWLAAWVQHTAGCDATGSCASVSCSTHIWLTIVIIGHLLYLAFFFFFFYYTLHKQLSEVLESLHAALDDCV